MGTTLLMADPSDVPLHVEFDGEAQGRTKLLNSRTSLEWALAALDAPDMVRTDVERLDGIDHDGPATTLETPAVRMSTWTDWTPRIESPTIRIEIADPQGRRHVGPEVLVLQPCWPRRPCDGPVEGVRETLRVLLAACASCSAPETRDAARRAHEALTDAVAAAVAAAQDPDMTDEVDLAPASPFGPMQARVYDRSQWRPTLTPAHQAAWHLCEALCVIVQRRRDGSTLLHMSPGSVMSVDHTRADPMERLRAIASLPPAPPPLRVVWDPDQDGGPPATRITTRRE